MSEPRGLPRSDRGRFGKVVNTVRNARAFSVPARTVARPIVGACDFLARQLQSKVWVNGAQVTYDGIDLTFPPGIGVHFASSLFWRGEAGFEPEVWQVVSSLLRRSARFADVGSNIGLYSVLARKLVPSVEVVAFEPVASLVEKHRQFLRANLVDGVRLFEGALSDHSGTASVYLPVGNHVEEEQTASVDPLSWQAEHPSSQRCEVAVVTLDDYCRSNSWWPDLVKIDVEGHEVAVLQGSHELLQEHRPAIVCEVLRNAQQTANLRGLLRGHKYTSFAILSQGLFQEDQFPPERRFEYYALLPGTGWPLFLPLGSLRELEMRALTA